MIIINQHWHVIVIKVLILNVTNMLKCCHCFMSLNSVFFIHFLRKTGLFPLSICQGLSVMNTSYSLRVLTLSFNCYTCREQIDAAEGIWLLTKLMTIILAATWCSQTTLLLNPFMPWNPTMTPWLDTIYTVIISGKIFTENWHSNTFCWWHVALVDFVVKPACLLFPYTYVPSARHCSIVCNLNWLKPFWLTGARHITFLKKSNIKVFLLN